MKLSSWIYPVVDYLVEFLFFSFKKHEFLWCLRIFLPTLPSLRYVFSIALAVEKFISNLVAAAFIVPCYFSTSFMNWFLISSSIFWYFKPIRFSKGEFNINKYIYIYYISFSIFVDLKSNQPSYKKFFNFIF